MFCLISFPFPFFSLISPFSVNLFQRSASLLNLAAFGFQNNSSRTVHLSGSRTMQTKHARLDTLVSNIQPAVIGAGQTPAGKTLIQSAAAAARHTRLQYRPMRHLLYCGQALWHLGQLVPAPQLADGWCPTPAGKEKKARDSKSAT